MNDYPKIYSISTVGIRQHGNTDFLLHSVRTDFTGNNGLGKSLIADLLQLIFVPLRDEWKPGTEGLDEKERRIETIPLDRQWITHAYCFLNIEKPKGKFLTIGVYIPRTLRSPVQPFIVQQGENFEDTKIPLKPFDRPLVANDFIAENLKIFDSKELQRHLFEKHSLHFKDFYQSNQINDYFDWLYKNHISPIDLTKETNLKSFAKILQSFSKAKTLKITDSKSLQNFLFEDDDEIKATFENQKENLNRHIRDYHRADQDIQNLKRKQELLGKLKTIHEQFVNTQKDYLLKNANLLFQKMNFTIKAFDDNETAKTKAKDEYETAKSLYETQCKDLYAKMLEQKAICNEIRIKLETEQAETGKSNLETLKDNLQNQKNFNTRLETLQPIITAFQTIETVKNKFSEQEKIKGQKGKFKQLKDNQYFAELKKSKWIDDYDIAYQHYNKRNLEIQTENETLNEVLLLYEGSNPNSLFNWAINQKLALTIEQETVLMAFKDIFAKKISLNEGKKYSLNPQSLLNSFTKEENGIWINLGDLYEFVLLVKEQRFNDKDKLEQALANDKKEIQDKINELKIEQQNIKNLNSIGLNQELINIYNQRERIENYKINALLTEDNVHFIKTNFDSFTKIETLKQDTDKLDKQIDEIVRKAGIIKSELDQNQEIIDDILNSLGKLNPEITEPIETTSTDYKALSKEVLVLQRKKYKNEIKSEIGTKDTTKSTRDNQKNKYDNANYQTITLRTTKETAERDFKTAKDKFEKETFENFDSQLQMGELNDEVVETAKTTFEDKQQSYWQKYTAVANVFEESKSENKNPELYDSEGKANYNYQTLENVLCGKIGLSGLTSKLGELNEQLKTFGELQMKILTDVFGKVETIYKDYRKTITNLNFFFEKQKVSNQFQFKVEFEPRKDINIDWIEKMKEKGKVHKYGTDLFTLPENMPSDENTPENLIKNIAKQFYSRVNADTSQLLNPKFYFTLKVSMEDEAGNKNVGSGGQAYTALALLCIGRLSIVQKEQRPGVKFIIIEELSNIDDTNFNIFPEIARQFGYQLITMTPKPFGSYTNDEWFLHMLVKGKENKDENYSPMSWFKTKSTKTDLITYIPQENELETV
jgi:hypothetical protein